MNVVINISNKAEADFWLKLAKEKGKNAIAISNVDAEDAWLSNLINKGIHSRTLTANETQEVLDDLKQKGKNAN